METSSPLDESCWLRQLTKFLDQLKHGTIPEARAVESLFDRETLLRPASIASDEEAAELNKAMDWMESRGLPRGEYGYELVAPGGELLATLDLAWFQGIQEGKSEKVALLIDESRETLHTANAVGFPLLHKFGGTTAACSARHTGGRTACVRFPRGRSSIECKKRIGSSRHV